MKKMLKSHICMGAAALLLLAGCDRGPPDGTVRVSDIHIRLPVVKGQPGAAYFKLEAGSEGTRLLGVSSPVIRRVELHETVMKGSVSKMQRKKEMEFPYDGELLFEPGGRHAMLFGMDSSVKAGDRIPLTFSFNVAPPVTVDAEVKNLTGESHEGH